MPEQDRNSSTPLVSNLAARARRLTMLPGGLPHRDVHGGQVGYVDQDECHRPPLDYLT
jgi:hypothetical protein